VAFTDSMPVPDSVDWGTPDDKFKPLDDLLDFTLDGAASHANAKVARYCTADGTFRRVPTEPGFCSCETNKRGGCSCEPPVEAFDCPHATLCGVHAREVAPGIYAVKIDERDGLAFPWANERVFLNPPWGESFEACKPRCKKERCKTRGRHADEYEPGITDFLTKARNEALRHRAIVKVVAPARTDTGWFHDLIRPYSQYRFERGRWKFIDPRAAERAAEGKKPRTGPPVGVLVAEFR
jgi:hypothetical protein